MDAFSWLGGSHLAGGLQRASRAVVGGASPHTRCPRPAAVLPHEVPQPAQLQNVSSSVCVWFSPPKCNAAKRSHRSLTIPSQVFQTLPGLPWIDSSIFDLDRITKKHLFLCTLPMFIPHRRKHSQVFTAEAHSLIEALLGSVSTALTAVVGDIEATPASSSPYSAPTPASSNSSLQLGAGGSLSGGSEVRGKHSSLRVKHS